MGTKKLPKTAISELGGFKFIFVYPSFSSIPIFLLLNINNTYSTNSLKLPQHSCLNN